MHRGALWASGAAQAAQFVRIILRWRGRIGISRGGFSFLLVLLVCYMTLAACEALSRALKAA